MEKIDWNEFWLNYRNIESEKEEDLFFQVGKTINKKPISDEIFKNALQDIVGSLNLRKEDSLLEMCCGNGLITFPLSEVVKYIYAFDFTPHLINTAKKFKQNDNIEYLVGDAKGDFLNLFAFEKMPNKFLMNDALSNFTTSDLESILNYISGKIPYFTFYITGIPNDALKWNFYNTEERKQFYLKGVNNGDESNDGMGKWWKKSELLAIAEKHNLKIVLKNQKNIISNYRMDVLFEKE